LWPQIAPHRFGETVTAFGQHYGRAARAHPTSSTTKYITGARDTSTCAPGDRATAILRARLTAGVDRVDTVGALQTS
jgi:hypothetical protein